MHEGRGVFVTFVRRPVRKLVRSIGSRIHFQYHRAGLAMLLGLALYLERRSWQKLAAGGLVVTGLIIIAALR